MRKRKKRKLILPEGKSIAEYPKISFTCALKLSPWNRKKNKFPNISGHTINSFIGGNPWVEAKISTNE